MKKFWAIVCVVGFTGFWTYGLIAVAGLFGDRAFYWPHVIFAAVGLGVGTYARMKINAMTSNIKRGLHVRPQQGQDEFAEQVHS